MYIQVFSQKLNSSSESLNLMTAKSQSQYATFVKKSIHNASLERTNIEIVTPPVMPWISRVGSFAYLECIVLGFVEQEKSVFLAGDVSDGNDYHDVMLLAFPVFYASFALLPGFFQSFLNRTIDRLESRAFSLLIFGHIRTIGKL